MIAAEANALRLARTVRWGGIAVVGAAAIMAALSYGLSTFFPVIGKQDPTARLLASWIDSVPLLGASIRALLVSYTGGHSVLADPGLRALAYHLPLAVATGVAIVMVFLLSRSEARIDPALTRSLTRIAIVCGVLHALSIPLFTRDLWLSVGWGRMALHGWNPYYLPMAAVVREGLPFPAHVLDGVPVLTGGRMTYGPFWAFISVGIAAVAGASAFLAFVASKLVLFAAWLVVLLGTRRIAARSSEREAAIATVILGWLPLVPVQVLAEGHNDIAMVAMVVLWFGWATRGGWRGLAAPVALTAAVLLKYIALPLGVLELIAAARIRRTGRLRYLLVLAGCAGFAGLALAPFYRSRGMFTPMATMRNWIFFSPADAAAETIRWLTGVVINPQPVVYALLAVGLLIIGYVTLRCARNPSAPELALASLAILWVVLFTAVGHIWPWFVIWPLPFAALLWHRPAGRAYVLVAALTPLLNFAWFRADGERLWTGGAGVLFLGACAVAVGVVGIRAWRSNRNRPGVVGVA